MRQSLNAGGDLRVLAKPRAKGAQPVTHTWAAAASAVFDKSVQCASGEQRGYVLTEPDQLSQFLPPDVTRDRGGNNLLPAWDYVKLLPPAFYVLVFELSASPGTYSAVPERKLSLDGYPQVRAGDPEKAAGFSSHKALRIVLRPNAFRFFWAGIHEPLRAEGVWPTARQVMERGFTLGAASRLAIEAKLAAISPVVGCPLEPWLQSLRAAVIGRHFPQPVAPTPEVPASDTRMPDDSSIASHLASLPIHRWVGVLGQMASQLPDVDVTLAECVDHPSGGLFDILEKVEKRADAICYKPRGLPPDVVPAGEDSCANRAYELESLTQIAEGKFGFTRILHVPEAGEDVHPYPNVTSIENPRWEAAVEYSYEPRYNASHPPPWAPDWHLCPQHSSERQAKRKRNGQHSQGRVWQFSQPRALDPRLDLTGGTISSSELPGAIAQAVSNLGMAGSVLMGSHVTCNFGEGKRGHCQVFEETESGSLRITRGLCVDCCPDCRFPRPDISTLKRMLPEGAWPHVREHVAEVRREADRWYASPIPKDASLYKYKN